MTTPLALALFLIKCYNYFSKCRPAAESSVLPWVGGRRNSKPCRAASGCESSGA